jgi:predicted O-methyltransferase YrrM
MHKLVSEDITSYAEAHSADESQVLKELRQRTFAEVKMPQMLSGHLQGRVLSLFSRLVKPRQVVEIGTYTGYSALCLAEGLRPDGMLHTIDIDPEMSKLAGSYFVKAGLSDRMTTHTGNASDVLARLPGPFDLVFIDADKTNYSNYYDLVIDKVSVGGLIIADNVLWDGKVLDADKDEETEALDAYNNKILADPRVYQVLLPIRDGLMVAQKTV